MGEKRGRVACRLHRDDDSEYVLDEMRVLRWVVYMMKSNGPKTEP